MPSPAILSVHGGATELALNGLFTLFMVGSVSTESVGTIRDRKAQDVHLDFHTAPEL